MEFGRLRDTRFPNLDTVDVYAYRNEFDYTRWVAGTTIKMCNVLWNSDYNDVVKFDNNILRDKWFDDLKDYYTITLDSDRSYVPEREVQIPIPYDVAARYNYMVISIPILPGSEPLINYENSDAGIRKWYFFIDSIDYRAPNNTGCRISLDVWTQYHNDIDIKYMMLQRGHAPVAYSDVDEYLANPIENNDYLLAPDITPSNAEVVRDSVYIPFGNEEKYVCFATTCPSISAFNAMGEVSPNDPTYDFGNITYSDTVDRYGYQLQVNGWGVGDGDNYSNLRLLSDIGLHSQNMIPNGTNMFAVAASQMDSFLAAIQLYKPTFLRTILAFFMVDSSMIEIDYNNSVFYRNVWMYAVTQKETQLSIQLSKEMFGFPEEYQHLAKLYTFPYSAIEITDNCGETRTIRVENTGSIVAHKAAMLAFPYINARIWFDGINGSGSKSYTWVDMLNGTHAKDMPNSDWALACFDLDIPCYALYMDANTAWKLDNFWTAIRGNANKALADYHSSARNANTAKENAEDSNDTMYSNQDRDAATLITNTNNTAICNRANADLTIAANTQNTNDSNSASTNITGYNNSSIEEKTRIANGISNSTATAENHVTVATAENTGAASLWSSAITGGMAGIGIGTVVAPGLGSAAGAAAGFAIGALGHIMSSGISYGASQDNASIIAQGNTVAVSQATQGNRATMLQSQSNATIVTDESNLLRTKTNTTNNTSFSNQTNNTNATMRENANNNAITMRADANASRNTGNANAGYTREALIANAKEQLESWHANAQYGFYASRNRAPIQMTPDKGDAYPDLGAYKGVQFKVKTMANGDIRQIGDTFMRYGYALNQVWNVKESGLCPMSHFCYWKAEDIWVDDRQSSNNAVQSLITNMFLRGVTIWKNPEEVGRVDIHDNK